MDFGSFNSPLVALVESATAETLVNPDWTLNLEICDAITAGNRDTAVTVMRVLKSKVRGSNPKVAILALTVAEACVMNCGEKMYEQIGTREFMYAIEDASKSRTADVRDKGLSLLNAWNTSLGASYPAIADTYEKCVFGFAANLMHVYRIPHRLRLEGIEFPAINMDENAPIITPPARGGDRVDVHDLPPDPYGRDSGGDVDVVYADSEFTPQPLNASGNEEMEGEGNGVDAEDGRGRVDADAGRGGGGGLRADADKVTDTVAYLTSLLDLLDEQEYGDDSGTEHAYAANPLVKNLVAQCDVMKGRIQVLLESELDESDLIPSFLGIYESIDGVLERAKGKAKPKNAGAGAESALLIDVEADEPRVTTGTAGAAVGVPLGAQPALSSSVGAQSGSGAVEPAPAPAPGFDPFAEPAPAPVYVPDRVRETKRDDDDDGADDLAELALSRHGPSPSDRGQSIPVAVPVKLKPNRGRAPPPTDDLSFLDASRAIDPIVASVAVSPPNKGTVSIDDIDFIQTPAQAQPHSHDRIDLGNPNERGRGRGRQKPRKGEMNADDLLSM